MHSYTTPSGSLSKKQKRKNHNTLQSAGQESFRHLWLTHLVLEPSAPSSSLLFPLSSFTPLSSLNTSVILSFVHSSNLLPLSHIFSLKFKLFFLSFYPSVYPFVHSKYIQFFSTRKRHYPIPWRHRQMWREKQVVISNSSCACWGSRWFWYLQIGVLGLA